MNTLLSKIAQRGYRHVAKPILFRMSPDSVHSQTLRVALAAQKSAIFRNLLHAIWAYDSSERLEQTVCGVRFRNPVGLSAGFDNNFVLMPLLKSIGFGFAESGSLTFQHCNGNARPWFHRLPKTKSLVVNKGLANDGAEAIVRRLQSYPEPTFADFPLNISVAKTNSPENCNELDAIADYIGSLKLIKRSGVGAMYTINISCPNAYGGEPFTTPAKLERLLSALDKLKLAKPVFVKMPSDLAWAELKSLLHVVAKHKVTGVTIHNLAKDRGKMDLRDSLPDSVKGNMSGKPTWSTSNEFIRRTRLEFGERFVIIGVGGIFSADDAYTKIRLGANLVELITGMIFEGPQLIGQINQGLVKLLERDGFDNISQAVGVDSRK